MKIIAIDSSGLTASVAIIEDDLVVAEYDVSYKKTHSQTLLPMLDELKKMTELDLKSVDAIAIAAGPGSFTGLRIGSATAKGLAQALNLPIIEIGTLEGMACNMYSSEALICPMMDARRSQVYTGIYTYEFENGTYELKTILEGCALSIEEICQKLCDNAEKLSKKVVLLGDGVPAYADRIKTLMKVPYTVAPAHAARQRAAAFGYLAAKKLMLGDTVTYDEHAPEYLRLSQAERERNEGIRNKGSSY